MYFPVKAKDLSNAVNKFKWARQLNEQLDDPKVRFEDCHANIDAIIMDGESFDPNKWFDADDKKRLLGKHLLSLLKVDNDDFGTQCKMWAQSAQHKRLLCC